MCEQHRPWPLFEGTGINLETCSTVQTVLGPIVEPSIYSGLERYRQVSLVFPVMSIDFSTPVGTCQCTCLTALGLEGFCILTCIRGFYPVAKLRSNSNWNLSCLLSGLWLQPCQSCLPNFL